MVLNQKEINDIVDNGKMIYVFDIDDTLISFYDGKPIDIIVSHCNKMYDEGNYIYIETARSSADKERTIQQLEDCGIKYNELIMDKVKAHIRIDDITVNTLYYKSNPFYYDCIYRRKGDEINRSLRKKE